jgi:CubicO group peptidase (beta-lactamase class C family)
MSASDPNDLPRATPESQGVSSAAILQFVAALEAQVHEVHSFMLLRHGNVIAEGGWSPYQPSQPHVLMSVSKSFTSTAVGIAVAEGRFSIDDAVLSFFPDEAPAQVTEYLAALRVRHLLSMSTGHSDDTIDALDAGPDWISGFFDVPLAYAPGTHFTYNTGATYVLSAIVQKTTGLKLVDYLEHRLFEPLGIAKPFWLESPQGISAGGFGLSATTEDVARLGQLYLQKGVWQGKQVVPESWVNEATKFQISNAPNVEVDWRQGYGYQFWRCRHNAYRGDGAFGQYCIVMPDQDVVLAMTGGLGDMQLPLDLVWDTLLPGIGDRQQLTVARDDLTETLSGLAIPPIAGKASSPISGEIAGRVYPLGPNELDLKSIAFDADGVVTFTTASAAESIACGYGAWNLGRTGVFTDAWVTMPAATATSGAWTADDTFTMVVRFYESMFYRTFAFRFRGSDVTVATALNVGFGPPPTLVFTAAAAA